MKKEITIFLTFIIVSLVFISLPFYLWNRDSLVEISDENVLSVTSVPAFPTAQGYGKQALNGNDNEIREAGLKVIKVTNLNNSGVGSLRYALEEISEPRVVLFAVSGVIELDKPIRINDPYVILAGQTAPLNPDPTKDSGIITKNASLRIETHDVIVRHMKFRAGDDPGEESTSRDSLSISSFSSKQDIENIMIDQVSMSWGVDENLALWSFTSSDPSKSKPLKNITIQNTIIAEGLHDSIHVDEGKTQPSPHSKGAMIGNLPSNITMYRNYLGSNYDRNPFFSGAQNAEFVNNIVHNWGDGPTKFRSSDPNTVNIIGNYYKNGHDTVVNRPIKLSSSSGRMHSNSRVYLSDNIFENTKSNYIVNDTDLSGSDLDQIVSPYSQNANNIVKNEPAFEGSGLNIISSSDLYVDLYSNIGNTVPERDRVDTHILDSFGETGEFDKGSARIIDKPEESVNGDFTFDGYYEEYSFYPIDSDDDGLPDSWEDEYDLDKNDDTDSGTLASNGYTHIENYINALAGDSLDLDEIYDTATSNASPTSTSTSTPTNGVDSPTATPTQVSGSGTNSSSGSNGGNGTPVTISPTINPAFASNKQVCISNYEKDLQLISANGNQISRLNDIANNVFEEFIVDLHCAGTISGYSDGSFQVDRKVTRAEFSKIAVNAFDLNIVQESDFIFKDVDNSNVFADFINTLSANNIINGYADGTFRPNNSITRAEASKIITNIIESKGISTSGSFDNNYADLSDNNQFIDFILFLSNYEPNGSPVFSGYNDNTFRPNEAITRGQISKIVALSL